MLYHILLCAKDAEAALSGGYALSLIADLSPTVTFCNSKLSLFFT